MPIHQYFPHQKFVPYSILLNLCEKFSPVLFVKFNYVTKLGATLRYTINIKHTML